MSGFDLNVSDSAVGAEIIGLNLSQGIEDATFAEVEDAFNKHSVVVIRDQALTPQQLVEFSTRFGTPQINVRSEVNRSETPEVMLISNVMERGKPVGSQDAGRYWHSDLCYLEKPSKVTLLNAIEVPEKEGKVFGDTMFAGVAAAYDALSEAQKRDLAPLMAANGYRYMWNKKVHEFGQRPPLTDEELKKYPPDAIHPLIRTHPITGRKCIFVCEGYTHAIVGMSEQEGWDVLEDLFAHIIRTEFRYTHSWRAGDLLMWDNCAVQHKATSDFSLPLRRLMQRCTVEGSTSF
jgi:taurine dioxygenase